jgi:hypothetical protein
MASRAAASWAALPAELLQHTFGFLSDEDRWARVARAGFWAGERRQTVGQAIQIPNSFRWCYDWLSLQRVPVPACACRLPVLDVCSSWCGALLAAPALAPTTVLTGADVGALLQQAAALGPRITQLRLEDFGAQVGGLGCA